MSSVVVQNSTFLDDFGNNQATPQQFAQLASSTSLANAQAVLGQLYAFNGTPANVHAAESGDAITVGLALGRANDPTSLLASPWAVREQALTDRAAVFDTYGADRATYGATLDAVVSTLGSRVPFDLASSIGYVSSAADRTIWLTLTTDQFDTLFGTHLLAIDYQTPGGSSRQLAWGGNLSLPDTVATSIDGLWVEQSARVTNPEALNSTNVHTPAGPLSLGNAVPSDALTVATPGAIAANYHFPLPAGVPTDPVGLIEDVIPSQDKVFEALNIYRHLLGLPEMTRSQFQVLSGGDPSGTPSGENTLDFSVVSGVVPLSAQYIYSMLGGTVFNAYQQAFFDATHHVNVVSSSFGLHFEPTANSPFAWAYRQLFVDGALANVTVSMAGGDQGSSGAIGNGIANYQASQTPAFALVVGGTSIVNLHAAMADPTLANLVSLALQDDPATVFGLVQSGLTTLPSHLADIGPGRAETVLQTLFETVWQSLVLTPSPQGLAAPYGANHVGSGSVDTSQPVPSYQSASGLNPTSSTGTGRGSPDVSALAGGDTFYTALESAFVTDHSLDPLARDEGTSAAAPLWASLTTEFNAIFHDQGLPSLGFYNDLLYAAAVIAPGSFNDILLGTNTDSFLTVSAPSGYFNTNLGQFMVPTGDGYRAAPGYDLASGLGTPNALLLARALTEIAHKQMSGTPHDVINADGHGGWTSGADQTLLFQTLSGNSLSVGLDVGPDTAPDAFGFFSQGSSSFAWTSQLAEQALQSDFDPSLVILFDKQAQGAVMQASLTSGQSLGVMLNGQAGQASQEMLSSPFGFADFFGNSGVRACGEPGGDRPERRRRQRRDRHRAHPPGRQDSLSLTFYRVDDATGAIGGLHPGDAGYHAALMSRVYQLTTGGTSIGGPGYGEFRADRAAARQRGRHRRHAAHQQHARQCLLGFRPGQ